MVVDFWLITLLIAVNGNVGCRTDDSSQVIVPFVGVSHCLIPVPVVALCLSSNCFSAV